MPPMPVRPADHDIEPELRLPPPRLVRLRNGAIRCLCAGWILVGLAGAALLMVEPVSDWLTACFGQIVPAEVKYTLDRREFSRSTAGRTLLAHLDYEWRGAHHHDARRVSSDLLGRFRSHTIIPVKVLAPWRALPWPRTASGTPWRQLSRKGLILAGLAIGSIGGLIGFGISFQLSQRRLVREGSLVMGRIIRYEGIRGRPIHGTLPDWGIVRVRYEYPRALGSRPLPPGRGSAWLFSTAGLPKVGLPVTILQLRMGARTRHGLYVANPYEACNPAASGLFTVTPMPDPGNG